MKRAVFTIALLAGTALSGFSPAFAGQAPYGSRARYSVSSHDRVYTGDQFSNTVSVVDPADEHDARRDSALGDPSPANFSPLYKGQVLVHGMGFSPDHRTIGVVSIGSNSVTFIDTATNTVKHITYVGRAPHEAFWTPDGKEVWVTVRGENYVDVLDGKTYRGEDADHHAAGAGHDDFLAGWQIRLCLLILQSRDRHHLGRHP